MSANNNNESKEEDLGIMDISFKELETLPDIPEGTTHIFTSGNKLTVLPNLPEGLEVLHCGNNKLTEIPELPESLKKLVCDFNKITVIPNLPETLEDLTCNNNKIDVLPSLPETLVILVCDNNTISVLPKLPPQLELIYCSNNNLKEIPQLPLTLVDVNFDKNELDDPYSSIYKIYKDSLRVDPATGIKYGDIKTFIREINKQHAVENLSVKRTNFTTNAISLEDFEEGEKVEVFYSEPQYRNLQNGKAVPIKPSMVFKQSSVRNLVGSVENGTLKNPLTREPVIYREVRKLVFLNENAAGGRRLSKKTRKHTTKRKNTRKAIFKNRR